MPWFNVDDGFANSKPVMRIPRRYRPAAIGVWTLTGSWSAKELTDGEVPLEVVEEYGGTPKIVDLLVASGLWERNHNNVTFRNWSKWQKTKQQVLDFRAAEADRKRKQRERKTRRADQSEPEASQENPTGVPPGHTPGHHRESDLPLPTPLPTPLPKYGETSGGVGTLGDARASDEPPPRYCPKHMPSGTLDRCGACADARRQNDDWLAARGLAAKAVQQAAARGEASRRAQLAADRQLAIADCQFCDADGYRDTAVCDHVDRTQTTAAGRAKVRAALGHNDDQEAATA